MPKKREKDYEYDDEELKPLKKIKKEKKERKKRTLKTEKDNVSLYSLCGKGLSINNVNQFPNF